jgi:hypothetical protein
VLGNGISGHKLPPVTYAYLWYRGVAFGKKNQTENRIPGMENGGFGWVKVENKAFRPDFGRRKNNVCENHQENRGFGYFR